MKHWIFLTLGIPAALCVAMVWAQSGNRIESLPAPPADSREVKLELQLRLMRNAESAMGVNHPRLAETQRRIAELEEELRALTTVPDLFAQWEDRGFVPRDIADQLSEQELRILVVRLAMDVKELRTRVAALERKPWSPGR